MFSLHSILAFCDPGHLKVWSVSGLRLIIWLAVGEIPRQSMVASLMLGGEGGLLGEMPRPQDGG